MRPVHDIKVWGGRFDNSKKNSCSTDRFLSLLQVYDHHQKIMSCNLVKKMTQSAIPDLNVVSDKTHYYRHQEQFMQEQTPIFKVMNVIGIPNQDCSTIFEMNFRNCANLCKPTDFSPIQREVPGPVLMGPNAITSLSLW